MSEVTCGLVTLGMIAATTRPRGAGREGEAREAPNMFIVESKEDEQWTHATNSNYTRA